MCSDMPDERNNTSQSSDTLAHSYPKHRYRSQTAIVLQKQAPKTSYTIKHIPGTGGYDACVGNARLQDPRRGRVGLLTSSRGKHRFAGDLSSEAHDIDRIIRASWPVSRKTPRVAIQSCCLHHLQGLHVRFVAGKPRRSSSEVRFVSDSRNLLKLSLAADVLQSYFLGFAGVAFPGTIGTLEFCAP